MSRRFATVIGVAAALQVTPPLLLFAAAATCCVLGVVALAGGFNA